jgi:uncharacterized protein (TIGR03437 family)
MAKRFFGSALPVLALTVAAHHGLGQQQCAFQLFAGIDPTAIGDHGPATQALLFQPHGLATDRADNLYIADTQNNRVRRVTSDGTIFTVAGTGTQGTTGDDGSAVNAQLALPEAVLAAPDGSLYISDTGNHRIRVVTPDGAIHPFVGTGHPGFSGDNGPAAAAEINTPTAMALGPDGSFLFADTNNSRIRRVDASGTITTVAGTRNPSPAQLGCCTSGDGGPAIVAQLMQPRGLAVASDGTIYIADTGNALVRKVAPNGTISTIAGKIGGQVPSQYPAPATSALASVYSIAILPDGSLLITSGNPLRFSPDGSTLSSYSPVIGAYLALDSQGALYVSGYSDVVTRIAQAGTAGSVYAGRNRYGAGAVGDSAIGPVLYGPTAMAVAPDGSLFVADDYNSRVVQIAGGIIRRVIPSQAPVGVAVDPAGNVYIATSNAIRQVSPDGTSKTVAGGGFQNIPISATSAAVAATSVSFNLYKPVGVVIHPSGNLYLALFRLDSPNNGYVVRITPDGMLQTIFTSALPGSSSGIIDVYGGMAMDPSGNLILPTTAGVIIRFNPEATSTAPALPPPPAFIDNVAAGPGGSIYLSAISGRIYQLAGGTFSTIYNRDLDQFPGEDNGYGVLDGLLATSMAVDSGGNLYVADQSLSRIRKLPAGSCTPVPQPKVSAIVPAPGLPRAAATALFAPGELITIYGSGIGPTLGVTPSLDANGEVPTEVAGLQVLFEGIPGPILYAGSGQVNAIIPFTMYGRTQIRVEVDYSGVRSDAIPIAMADTATAVFTVVNPDGSLNSSSQPAPAGSYVVAYGTGFGRTSPEAIDGQIAGAPLPQLQLPVTVDGGLSVLYAGPAPGIVEGVVQINLQLPKTPISSYITLKAGDISTLIYVESR